MSTRVVVEWTRMSLRVAVAQGGGARWRLRTLAVRPLDASANVAQPLRSLLASVKLKPDEVINVISREQVITRTIKFPTVQPEELARMTELYARGQLPYPREQVITDSYVLSHAEGSSVVAMVACVRDVVDRQTAILREAGCPQSFMTVSSWGVLGWWRLAAAGAKASEEPTLIINVDDSRSDFVLIAGSRILSSRSVGQGARDWSHPGDVIELLKLEVDRSRAALRKELPGTDVRSVLLTGLGVCDQWREALATSLGLPVAVRGAREPLKIPAPSGSADCSAVVVGGIACSDLRQLLNLSPLELRGHLRHRHQVRQLVLVALLVGAILVAGTALLGVRLARDRQVAAQLEQQVTEATPRTRQLQERLRLANVVNSVLAERRAIAETLAGAFQSTPSDILLDAVVYERPRRELIVRGSAPSTQTVLDYQARLSHVAGVAAAELKYTKARVTAAGERTDFELALRQVPPE